jgi:hypothetical protein
MSDADNLGPHQNTPVPHRDSVSQMQIGAILSVMHALQPYLLYNVTRDVDAGHPELDGGSAAAATSTFVKACERMEKILSDENRWTLSDHDELIRSILKTQAGIQAFNEENVTTVRSLRLPHRKYHPQFAVAGEFYIAFAGDPSFPGGQIIGKGRTPQEALDDFDSAFVRVVPDQHRFNERSQERIRAAQTAQHAEETVNEATKPKAKKSHRRKKQ